MNVSIEVLETMTIGEIRKLTDSYKEVNND
jgi:hypothetical protein